MIIVSISSGHLKDSSVGKLFSLLPTAFRMNKIPFITPKKGEYERFSQNGVFKVKHDNLACIGLIECAYNNK